VPPAYFRKHGKPRVPTDLLNMPCIRVRLPNGVLFRWQFEKGSQTAQIDVAGQGTLDETGFARAAVLEGIGLGFFMEQDVRDDIKAKRLVRVLEDWTPPFAGLCLYYPSRRNPSAALKAFIAMAREHAKSSNENGES
ncbi:MAG TPA: LysR family transcriptional regulator, partial [Rhodobiaceae bacterium]|nr:LysR family transcriptional regulator [Rhodobiaceae bacterium]